MAKKKFYAVKIGRQVGIYDNWDDCKAQVNGFKGAKYQGFVTKDEAQSYLDGSKSSVATSSSAEKVKASSNKKDTLERELRLTKEISNWEDTLAVYVDGSATDVDSFGKKLDHFRYSFGLVVVKDNEIVYEDSGEGTNREASALRNVSGEMLGAMKALQLLLKTPDKNKVVIFHDYEGVGKWVEGEWEAKNPFVKKYVEFMESNSQNVKVVFFKVAGHSSNPFNERADQLARAALGI